MSKKIIPLLFLMICNFTLLAEDNSRIIMSYLGKLSESDKDYDYHSHSKTHYTMSCVINLSKDKKPEEDIEATYTGKDLESTLNTYLALKLDDMRQVAFSQFCLERYTRTDWADKVAVAEKDHNKNIRTILALLDTVPKEISGLITKILRIRYVQGYTYRIVGGKLIVDPESGLNYPQSSGEMVKQYLDK